MSTGHAIRTRHYGSVTMLILLAVASLILFAILLSDFIQPLLNRLQEIGNTLYFVMTGGKLFTITSQAMFEDTLLCLHQRAKGCDQVNTGTWDTLKDTPLERCPCGGDRVSGTPVRADVRLENANELTLPQSGDFAEFTRVELTEDSCMHGVTRNVKGVLDLYEFDNYVIPNGSTIEMVVNWKQRVGPILTQGCIDIRESGDANQP